MNALFGNSGADLQKKQLQASQRQQLADLARQQAETDQAAAGTVGRKTGSRMLTFLSGLSGDGTSSLGGA